MCIMPDANRMPVPMESHQADFPHSLQALCTRTRALIQIGFFCAKVRCKKIRVPSEFPIMVPMAHRTINPRDPTRNKPRDV
jgi:hypothetical protein